MGGWGLGIRDWGLGIGGLVSEKSLNTSSAIALTTASQENHALLLNAKADPHYPIPNPQSPNTQPPAPSLQHPAPTLIGGLYGVSIGGAFFGESMFSHAPDASKIALVTLVEILSEAGYELLDTQYVNAHLKQFGVEAWPKARYMTKLENALRASPNPSSLFSTVSVRKGLASSSSVSFTSAS